MNENFLRDFFNLTSARTACERRDLFAAAALAGMTANPSLSGKHSIYACEAREYADCLIAELDKPVTP